MEGMIFQLWCTFRVRTEEVRATDLHAWFSIRHPKGMHARTNSLSAASIASAVSPPRPNSAPKSPFRLIPLPTLVQDLRRCRSGMLNLAPTSTGSATAIATIFPELKGKLNGLAIRVPMLNASITDCVFEVRLSWAADVSCHMFVRACAALRTALVGPLCVV